MTVYWKRRSCSRSLSQETIIQKHRGKVMADSERPPMTAANGDILWPRFTYDRIVYIHSHCLIHLTITGSSLTILAYMLYRLLHQQVSREVYRMVSTVCVCVCMWIQLIVCLWVASHELIKQNKQTNKKNEKGSTLVLISGREKRQRQITG